MLPRRIILLVVVLLATLPGSPAVASGTATSASPAGTEQVLFRGGTDGYGCFRIPALVRTPAGVLLAFAEGRKSPACGDRGDIDIVLRRSTNDGRSWGPIQVVLAGSPADPAVPYTRGNPAPVVDSTTGRVLLLSTSNPATAGGQRLPWVQHSDDDGRTWSAAEPIAATFDGTHNGWFATGPSHGVQLRSGRLVVGAHQVTGGQAYPGVLFSDDGGSTWSASVTASSDGLNPGEISVAELPDGSVYAAARNAVTTGDHRAYAISSDGGTTMPAFTTLPSLVSPDVQGAVLAPRSFRRAVPGDTLLFTGPSDPSSRKVLQVRYSTDGGRSWVRAPGGQLTDQQAGYSDLAELGGGELGVLYEGGVAFSADELRFNRFSPAALGIPGVAFTGSVSAQPSVAPGPTTPDVSGEANDAYLAGNATALTGSLTLDGTGDYADVPYARSLDPGSGDLTFALRFKYAATSSTAQQALLWAYGAGTGAAQVWVRLQPAQDRAYAWVQGTSGGVPVAVTDPSSAVAFGDGAWHSLSLTRSGSTATLTIDGSQSTATGVAGSITGAAPTGIRLGAKQDSAASDAFAGALADVRLDQALRLPFNVTDSAVTPARTAVALAEDISGHCTAATLLGGWRGLTTGAMSSALVVDTAHPGAETPYTPALDVGSGDFTLVTWFRYTGSADQALVWAYGATAGKRSLWVRAQPGQDRVYAWAQTETAAVAVAVPGSAGDGAWHQLVLRRSGTDFRLAVDGAGATATGLTGSFTATPADGLLGLRLGSKPGGTDVLQGAVDDTRLYRRALTDTELTSALSARYPSDLPALWWSFDSAWTQAHDVVRPADGPATPDSSARCRHAYVRGGATLTTGKFGSALKFDGTDDAAEVAYGAPLALGDHDFTFTAWLRYTATASTRDQVLLWAYGVGGAERSLWLRAQPGKDRLLAWATTDTGTTGVAAADASAATAFGDGAWHHIALTRAAGVLSLGVDGTTLGSAPIAGSLTYGDAFAVDGLRLGARPDGVDPLAGSLDEVRLFDRALTGTELATVRAGGDPGSPTVLRLPFDVLSSTGYAQN